MSEPENFVARWSRLKRDTAKEETQADAVRSDLKPNEIPAAVEQGAQAKSPEAGQLPEPAFDPATLPPIESITADSDIRAFLQSGVPADLTKAALRRVWTTDPAIRDFIGIAENQWDFTDPTAMPGFGPLEATDDVRKLVAQAMGKLGQISESAAEADVSHERSAASASSSVNAPLPERSLQVAGMPEGNQKGAQADDRVEEHNKIVSGAPQHTEERAEDRPTPNRRAHGRALPR
jgi:Protein of unknown function (DUF3306)